MACMKCGKDTQDGWMFCPHCLEVMEAYPVKPDIHIQLPVRNRVAAPKKQTRKTRIDPKDAKIAAQRVQIRWLWVVVITLLLAVAVLLLRSPEILAEDKIGQNYTYMEPTT